MIRYLSIKEFAAELGVEVYWVKNRIIDGSLVPAILGKKGKGYCHWFIRAQVKDMKKWMETPSNVRLRNRYLQKALA